MLPMLPLVYPYFVPLTLHASDITNAFDKGIVISHNLEQESTPSCPPMEYASDINHVYDNAQLPMVYQ